MLWPVPHPPETLAPYFEAGVQKVIVAAPVKEGALNIVYGINDDLYDPGSTIC
jgi:glyceraldehyde 3-phosphate dehydrogenase